MMGKKCNYRTNCKLYTPRESENKSTNKRGEIVKAEKGKKGNIYNHLFKK